MTQCVLRFMESLLYEVYDEDPICPLPPDIIRALSELGTTMEPCLGSTRNAYEVSELCDVIKGKHSTYWTPRSVIGLGTLIINPGGLASERTSYIMNRGRVGRFRRLRRTEKSLVC